MNDPTLDTDMFNSVKSRPRFGTHGIGNIPTLMCADERDLGSTVVQASDSRNCQFNHHHLVAYLRHRFGQTLRHDTWHIDHAVSHASSFYARRPCHAVKRPTIATYDHLGKQQHPKRAIVDLQEQGLYLARQFLLHKYRSG
jgi:hypothetical protein